MKGAISFFWESAKVIILAFLIVAPIRMFVFQPFLVSGASMEPNLHSGDYLIVDELSYRFREPSRGEVVVFQFPLSPSQRYIKRIIGLPGETVEVKDGKVIVYDANKAVVLNEQTYLPLSRQTPGNSKVSLKENEYFVLGDNREFSSDSRAWGILKEQYIIGRALVRLLPLTAIAAVKAPTY